MRMPGNHTRRVIKAQYASVASNRCIIIIIVITHFDVLGRDYYMAMAVIVCDAILSVYIILSVRLLYNNMI